MRRLTVFNSVTVDGYFTATDGDLSWAHKRDPEWDEYVAGNASGDSALVFGRITYDMMVAWWPTPNAAKAFPVVAQKMNSAPKIVFSRTLEKATWNNTRIVKGDPGAVMRKMKSEPGPDMTVLGSGSIVAQLAAAGVVDEFQMVVNPVALGQGRTMFEAVAPKIDLKLVTSRAFKNGNVLLVYKPVTG